SKRGYLTGILYLFPYKSFGFNVCPNAENADCHEPCLNTAGRGRFNQVQAARLRKTWLFHNEREWFMERLFLDIEALQRKAQREGLLPAVRLNGTSDLDWESIRYQGESPMEHSSLTQFYDYTKLPRQVRNKNYHLTFSYSTDTKFQSSVKKAQRLGMNMAVVSDLPIPEAWMGRSVVNGDNDDLRFLDPDNCIVWLKVKGQALGSDSDLIVRAA
ncbi:MAG: hypothetical protein DRR04_11585, partial [Gammaproteobacteria bacterium]